MTFLKFLCHCLTLAFQTFEEIKSKLSLLIVLKFFKFEKHFEVNTNTSNFAIGGVLMQDGRGVFMIIGVISCITSVFFMESLL